MDIHYKNLLVQLLVILVSASVIPNQNDGNSYPPCRDQIKEMLEIHV